MKKSLAAAIAAVILFSTVAFAATSLMPSVVSKDAPSVIGLKDAEGNDVTGIITDKDGNPVVSVPYGAMIVTPYAEKEGAAQAVGENLEHAYDDLSNKKLGELSENIGNFVKEKKIDEDSLVVRELFEVTVDSEYLEKINESGNALNVKFDANWSKDDSLIILVYTYNCNNSDQWELVPAENVRINPDGTIDVAFNTLCAIAFVTSTKESPPTGISGADNSIIGVAVAVVVFGAAAVLLKKKADR